MQIRDPESRTVAVPARVLDAALDLADVGLYVYLRSALSGHGYDNPPHVDYLLALLPGFACTTDDEAKAGLQRLVNAGVLTLRDN